MVECGCRCQCGRGITSLDHDHRTPVVVRNTASPPPEAEAVLESLAMGGLVAVLRQLGDLAELAAEVFDGLQGQVTAASARGRRLAARAKQLAADLPPSTTHKHHPGFLSNTTGRLGWRANLKLKLSHGVVAGADTPRPRLVVARIKRCRGPPALSVLDRFDADGGEGACLKRYTDPSFFRANAVKLQHTPLPHGYLKTMEIRPGFHTSADSSDEPPKSAHTDSKPSSQTEDASENPPSPGFLWMLRQLKHRQAEAAGSVFPSLKLQQLLRNIQKRESSAAERGRDSSAADTSEQVGDRSPEFEKAKEKENHHQCSAGPSKSGSSLLVPSNNNNHRSASDDAGSDTDDGGACGEMLERTSSFEAWLSPDADARFFLTAAQESSEGALAHTSTSTSTVVEARPNPVAAEQKRPCKKDAGNHKRSSSSSKYRGSIEMIAARVSSLPRKLFSAKHQHEPLADSSRSATAGSISDCGNPGSIPFPIPFPREEAFVPVLISSDQTVLGTTSTLQDGPLPETESARPQCTGGPSISYDAETLQQQEDACILNQRRSRSRSSSSTAEICRDRTCNETPGYTDNLLLVPRIMQRTGAPELHDENPPSEGTGTRVDARPLPPPVPPMQWLSEKVSTAVPRSAASSPRLGGTPRPKPLEVEVDHQDRSNNSHSVVRAPQAAETMTVQARSQRRQNSEMRTVEALIANENASGDVPRRRDENKCSGKASHRQPFRGDDVHQASEGSVVKTTGELPALITVTVLPVPDEAQSELDPLQTQQAQAGTRFLQQGEEGGHQSGSTGGCSSGHGSSSTTSEEEHVVVSDSSSGSNVQKESVFFSAVQELAKMSLPPAAVPVPARPKYSVLGVGDAGSHSQDDRITLRNGPSPIHPSRNILDTTSVLLEQIKDKSAFSLTPASPSPGSPTNSNSRVATILQKPDDIRRQAHAADRNINGAGSEDGWSDDGE